MRLERSKNLVHNLKWGVLYRLSGMLIPFVCKATIIRNFGVNYLGLSSLFASIISTLNLAELGFGSAVVFFMYKEIAEENAEKICALLNYFKRVYRIVGTVILTLGLALMPFLKYLIKKDIPDDIDVIHMDGDVADGPFGSTGASEAFQASGHCAVLNGIYNACGVRIHEIPALPSKVKAGLDAIDKGEKPYAPEKYFLGSDLYEELENLKANPVQPGPGGLYVSLDDPTAERPF